MDSRSSLSSSNDHLYLNQPAKLSVFIFSEQSSLFIARQEFTQSVSEAITFNIQILGHQWVNQFYPIDIDRSVPTSLRKLSVHQWMRKMEGERTENTTENHFVELRKMEADIEL